jgi:pimeloyl-ACP methyl ester carboxylesterase
MWRHHEIAAAPAGRLAVFEAGRQDPQAPVAVLVHGLGHWAQGAWDGMALRLQETHRIIAFDLPGFGASDKPDVRYDLPFFIETLHALVTRLGLARFTLIGHSLGGMICADYAGTHGELIERLVLVAPAGFLRTPKIFVRIVAGEPVSRLFSLRPSRRFVRSLLEQTFYDQRLISDEMYEHAYELSQDPSVCRAFLRVYAGALRDFLDMPGFHARLARYTGPTLLVWGRQDQFIPVRALAGARKVYPHADVLLLERCGHSPNVEMPDHIVQRILSGPIPRVVVSHELTAVQYAVPGPPANMQPADAFLCSHVQGRVFSALELWAQQHGSGRVGTGWSFTIAPPDETPQSLTPDVAYLSYERVSHDADLNEVGSGIAPDVAVHILKPDQHIEALAENIRGLLAAGSQVVIVIDPRAECAILYDTRKVQRIDAQHHLTHPALPGFQALVSWFFENPAPRLLP